MANPQQVTPAAAIYAFAGWLTCREDAVTFGARHDAALVAELVDEFCRSQGFEGPDGDWTAALKPYPSAGRARSEESDNA